jgi:hypothetical protein
LLGDDRHCHGGVVVLDQVNPFPFMLGWPPAHGNNLWSGPGAPVRPADEIFADATYVLIPKFSNYGAWTKLARLAYGPYLSDNFRTREDTQSWIALSREGANHATVRPGRPYVLRHTPVTTHCDAASLAISAMAAAMPTTKAARAPPSRTRSTSRL